jgi:hypothetical protein
VEVLIAVGGDDQRKAAADVQGKPG